MTKCVVTKPHGNIGSFGTTGIPKYGSSNMILCQNQQLWVQFLQWITEFH